MKVDHQFPHSEQQLLHLGAAVDYNIGDLRPGHWKTLRHSLVKDPGLCYDTSWLANIGLKLG